MESLFSDQFLTDIKREAFAQAPDFFKVPVVDHITPLVQQTTLDASTTTDEDDGPSFLDMFYMELIQYVPKYGIPDSYKRQGILPIKY